MLKAPPHFPTLCDHMTTFLQTYSKEIVSLLAPVLTWVLANFLRARVRLVWSSPHSWNMLLENQPIVDGRMPMVRSASLTFQNLGRETAKNVEIVFNWRPEHSNIWPQRAYDTATNPDGRFIFKFPNLAPKESFGIEIMSFQNELPAVVSVRCEQALGQQVQMLPQLVLAKWKIRFLVYLLLAGIGATAYMLYTAIAFIGSTP
jgi:hypothetical protein